MKPENEFWLKRIFQGILVVTNKASMLEDLIIRKESINLKLKK
jgi:hypothetical protein